MISVEIRLLILLPFRRVVCYQDDGGTVQVLQPRGGLGPRCIPKVHRE